MDSGYDIPWVEVKIPGVEGHNTMGKGVKIPRVAGKKIPWITGSKYHR